MKFWEWIHLDMGNNVLGVECGLQTLYSHEQRLPTSTLPQNIVFCRFRGIVTECTNCSKLQAIVKTRRHLKLANFVGFWS